MENVKLGMLNNGYYTERVEEHLPNAQLLPVENIRSFLKNKHSELDALVFSTEVGSAWSMLYPEFSAVTPKGFTLKVPVGFALPKGDIEYVQFINTWLKLKKDNGFQEQVYNYWILGKNPKAKKPRWSVLKDVWGITL